MKLMTTLHMLVQIDKLSFGQNFNIFKFLIIDVKQSLIYVNLHYTAYCDQSNYSQLVEQGGLETARLW